MADGTNRWNSVTSLIEEINYNSIRNVVLDRFLGRESAIYDVKIMDERRTDEFRDAASQILTENELTDAITPNGIAWDSVSQGFQNLSHIDRENLSTLQQRLSRTYPTLIEFTIDIPDLDEPLEFNPGQFVDIRYNGTRRQYSIASSPNDGELTLCIRRVPGGKLTEDLLSNIQDGDEMKAYYPRGDFTLDENSGKDLVFLATGTGVAPFRSMIRYLYQEDLGEDRDVWLFLGTRWKDDLPYHAEFKELERRHEGFHYIPTLSRESIVSTWEGETDYVQEIFLKYLAEDTCINESNPTQDTFIRNLLTDGNHSSLDIGLQTFLNKEPRTDAPATIEPGNIQVYVCGVDDAVSIFKRVTTSIGVPRTDVYSEGYG